MMRPPLSPRFRLSCKIARRRMSRVADIAEDIDKTVFLSHEAVLSSRKLLTRLSKPVHREPYNKASGS